MSTVAEKVHSILSPSGAKRWSKCVAALAACKGVVEKKDTRAADLGSAKHQSVEWLLRNPNAHLDALKAQELAFYNSTQFTVDAEYSDHVNTALHHARSLGGDQSYETWVSTEPLFGIPGQGGTIDLYALHAYDGYIDVLDFKFGFTPYAPDGPQNKIYAAALLAEIDPDRLIYTEVRLHISQPKQSDQLKSVKMSRDELDAYIASIRDAAQAAHRLYVNAEALEPGVLEAAKTPSDEACEWCPIRLTCSARLAQLNADFPIMPAPPVGRPITYDPVQMTAEELDSALTRVDSVVKFIQDWATNIRAEGTRRAALGQLPGWMVADGKKGARTVPDADKPMFEMVVAADLGDEAYEKKLKTPTQLELAYKRLKRLEEWRTIQDGPADAEGVRRGGFVVQAAGVPSLARTTEGRAAQGTNLAAEFALVEAQ